MTQKELNTKNMPEQTFKAGAISATIWANVKHINNTDVTIRTVVIERSYKDKDGNWQKTTQFGINDLPRLTLVSQKAFEYLTTGDSE